LAPTRSAPPPRCCLREELLIILDVARVVLVLDIYISMPRSVAASTCSLVRTLKEFRDAAAAGPRAADTVG